MPKLLWSQFNSPLIWLLMIGAGLSVAVADMQDALAIVAIVMLNGLIGFAQEFRAERAMQALRHVSSPHARVVRDDHAMLIDASMVVPGDLLLLEAGDIVAADAKVIQAHNLGVNEAILTGESELVEKHGLGEGHTKLNGSTCGVFMGTAIARGSAQAEVSATGMQTELGKIAHLIVTAHREKTPLQRRLARLGQMLIWVSLTIVILIAVVSLARGDQALEVLMTAISLAVAAVPEGLPAIVTIALAIGVQRMASRNVLVRKLLAVETLGSVNVICTDKTGTLTTGHMRVREVWGADARAVLQAGAACCDAEITDDSVDGVGDPTEVAILMAAREHGIHRRDIETSNPRMRVNPFETERKMMSILRADQQLYVKGAYETVIALCTGLPADINKEHTRLAELGLRVLAVAIGHEAQERELEFIGLLGIADPPRPEAAAAIAQARSAGIDVIMITGDNAITANAIASELGLVDDNHASGDYVKARTSPQDKLSIVRELKATGAVVAMTGDGVNDAPALREADVGIAMGFAGTQIAREAADIVLTDDNFASIIAAVHEGRGVFQNIRKALVYLLAGNTGELLIVLAARVWGYPAPLLPLHLLWINLMTDGPPALALAMDPAHETLMTKRPRHEHEPLLRPREWRSVASVGLLNACLVLSVFGWYLAHENVSKARSMAFSVLVVAELFRSFASRNHRQPLWRLGLLTNSKLLVAVAGCLALQVGLYQLEWLRHLLTLHHPTPGEYAFIFGLGLVPVTLIETTKILRLFGAKRTT